MLDSAVLADEFAQAGFFEIPRAGIPRTGIQETLGFLDGVAIQTNVRQGLFVHDHEWHRIEGITGLESDRFRAFEECGHH